MSERLNEVCAVIDVWKSVYSIIIVHDRQNTTDAVPLIKLAHCVSSKKSPPVRSVFRLGGMGVVPKMLLLKCDGQPSLAV